MRKWYQSKTQFEKRFKAVGRDNGGTWAKSFLYVLGPTVFKFPVRTFYRDDRQIDSLYLELTAFCLFSTDFFLATEIPDDYPGKEEARRTHFDFNFMVMEELWNRSALIRPIVNDRMTYYGSAATNPSGWPIAEIAMNLHLSATMTVDRGFCNSSQLPPIEPRCLPLGTAWSRWATLVTHFVPECFDDLTED